MGINRTKMSEKAPEDVMDRLPRESWTVDLVYGKLIRIKRGVMGYFPTPPLGPNLKPQEMADKLNAESNVTKAQAEAMVNGSMFGFHCPAADPLNYNDDGSPKKIRTEGK